MAARRMPGSWTRADVRQLAPMLAVVAALHVLGFGALIAMAPREYHVGAQVFSIGLGLTAYMFGLRHAFDADHIAAIDNVTRKLSADGARPRSVGFWFALGHSAMVVVLALVVVGATSAAGALLDDGSPARRALGIAGTLASGGFLLAIALVNAVALVALWRVLTAMRAGNSDRAALAAGADTRGLLGRILHPVISRIRRPHQMAMVGALFGLGFDTATEVALLALAGTGAAAGMPWYAVLILPVLFAAGMTLMDTVDGVFMAAAYDWALTNPMRKVFYNLTITGLSVAVAGAIGAIELVSVARDLGWTNPVSDAVSGMSLEGAGFIMVGLFAATWAVALVFWRMQRRRRRATAG